MTLKTEWKIAKWLYRHGPTKRIDIPKWFLCDMAGYFGSITATAIITMDIAEIEIAIAATTHQNASL